MRSYGEELYCVNSNKRSLQGNTVFIEGDAIKEYGEGYHCHIIKLYAKKGKKVPIDWESFVILNECGKNVDKYMREMREYDCC